eukprot:GHRR01015659.1.p1 GENE.GHRR01015659.1~~GHRR01015659.1.p1  ORF type:complete len:189 (+),score=29.63 GHRR01015659.1:210-776(+)
MDLLRNILPGQGQQQPNGGQPSLLADWNTYQEQADVEAGTTSTSNQITKTAEDVSNSITSFFRTGYAAVSDGVSNVQAPNLETTFPSGQQLVHFFSLLGVGVLFLILAFFVGLPTLLLSPSKFALFFTIGCCLVFSGFAALKGWRSQMKHMLQRERLPFSAGAFKEQQLHRPLQSNCTVPNIWHYVRR